MQILDPKERLGHRRKVLTSTLASYAGALLTSRFGGERSVAMSEVVTFARSIASTRFREASLRVLLKLYNQGWS